MTTNIKETSETFEVDPESSSKTVNIALTKSQHQKQLSKNRDVDENEDIMEKHSQPISFRQRAARRASKALQRIPNATSKVLRRASQFAQSVDSGIEEMQLSENRFHIRSSSRTLLKEEKDIKVLAVLYDMRQKLQKVEFLVIWLLVVALVITALIGDDVYDVCDTIALNYIRYSVISRFLAYVMDFTNAAVKLGTGDEKWRAIPLWLWMHHGGVLGSHVMIAFFFMDPVTFAKYIFGLVANQSSHNTWTKKYSYFLYWGNVALGFASLCCIAYIAIAKSGGDYVGAIILICSVVCTLCGVLLLVKSVTATKKTEKKPSGPPPVKFPIGLDVENSCGALDGKITEDEENKIMRASEKM